MEVSNENKVGAGIITISVLTFIGGFFGIIGTLFLLAASDSLSSFYSSIGLDQLSNTELIISLLVEIVLVISTILILMKKAIGVYGYFIIQIISIIFSIITAGFSFSIIISLILPVLMAVFISNKKEVFFG